MNSDDSPGQVEGVRQADASDAVQAPGRADAQGRTAGRRLDQGLRQFLAAPLQEARLQELPEHLPAIFHSPSLQYSVIEQLSSFSFIHFFFLSKYS